MSEISVLKDLFVLTEKQIRGHHFNDLHFIQVENNPRCCEGNLCNCVRSLKKIQDFNGIPLKSRFFCYFFFSSIHCVHNCEDHWFFTWFHFRSSHIWFISYVFVTLHFIVLLKISSIFFINASSDKFTKFKTLLLQEISVEKIKGKNNNPLRIPKWRQVPLSIPFMVLTKISNNWPRLSFKVRFLVNFAGAMKAN